MIFDKQKELELLESQPEWIGIDVRIKQLNSDLSYWSKRLDKDPKEWIAKKIQKVEEDIKFFENILLFWAANYDRLDRLGTAIERQIKVANKGAELMDLIEDLRTAYKYELEENKILSEVFIELSEKMKLKETEKIRESLNKLAVKVKDYLNYINGKINKMINE